MSTTQAPTRDSLDMQSEMLPQDPPPKIVRFVARLIVAIFFAAFIGSVLIRLPETVNSPFILVPKNGGDPIQSPRLSSVTRVGIAEGQTVTAGTELFVLRSDEIRGWDTEQRTMTEELRAKQESLARGDAAYIGQLEIKLQAIAQAESELKFRDKHTSSNRELLERMEKLSKTGGISQVELIRLRLDVAESEKDHSVADRTLQQIRLEREQLESEHQRKRGELVAEIEKLRLRLDALKGDLENSQLSLLSIRAPYDAVVISLSQRSAGSVVREGQELCQLASVEAKPQARLTVAETGLAKLSAGQRVRFFFDAFPYQRYGTVTAKIDWISPSAVTTTEGSRFVALSDLDSATYGRGKPLALRVGMKGRAHIITGRRALIEYAFEPLGQLMESMRN